jgi:hypothetical protein
MPSRYFSNKVCFSLITAILFSHLLFGEELLNTGISLTYINVALLCMQFFLTCINGFMHRSFTFNRISILQFAMLCFFLIMSRMGLYKLDYFWGNYLSFVASFVIMFSMYCIFNNHNSIHIDYIGVIVRLYTVILASEIVYEAGMLYSYGIFSSNYKTSFKINLGGSNNIGFYLLFLFFILYFTKKGTFDNFLLLLLFACMLLISSRGTLLALIIVYFGLKIRQTRMVIIFVSFMVCLLLFDQAVLDTLTGYLPFLVGFGDDLSSGRYVILGHALDLISTHKLAGIGLGNFTVPELSYMDVEAWRPHNILLEIQLVGGVVATALFIASIASLVRDLLATMDNQPYVKGVFYGVVAILLQGMTEPNIFNYRIDTFFWFFVGSALAISCKGQCTSSLAGDGPAAKKPLRCLESP